MVCAVVQSSSDRRRAPRYTMSAVVRLNGVAEATLVNVSSIGVCLETDVPLQAGQVVSFVLPFQYAAPTETRARCTGRITRVERLAGRCRVGASYELTAIDKLP